MSEYADRQRALEREMRESLKGVVADLGSDAHEGVTYLRYYGSVQTEEVLPGHTLWLRIEESTGATMVAGREGVFEMPWLRSQCACGWSDDQRFSIDSNARVNWLAHIERERNRLKEQEES